jgi:PPOX class probable F420-dependent enzyme
MQPVLEQFQNQQYLNLETFRRNGLGVKTPIWFAQDEEALYAWTQTDSGKAKRIRFNPDVRIAPAKADGTPLGEWMPAKAHADESGAALAHVERLFKKKYGAAFILFGWMGKMRGAKYTSIRLQVEGGVMRAESAEARNPPASP